MFERLVAYVACHDLLGSAVAHLTPARVAAQIGAALAGTPIVAEPTDLTLNTALGDGFALRFDGGPLVSVIIANRPLPQVAYVRAVQLNRTWPHAAAAIGRHRAHIIVGLTAEPTDHLEALNGAAYVTMATAAIAALTPALAVVWSTGDAVSEAAQFQHAAGMLAQKQISPEAWVGFEWLDGPRTPQGERTLAVVTTGLRAFIGREIEWLPSPLPPLTIAQRMIGLLQYLIVSGPVIADGDTLGISEAERIRARHSARGHGGGPVIQLSVERLEPEPRRFTPPAAPALGRPGAAPVPFGRKRT